MILPQASAVLNIFLLLSNASNTIEATEKITPQRCGGKRPLNQTIRKSTELGMGAPSTGRPGSTSTAIVIGGGPVGLATALMLAGEPHNYNVELYESSSGESSASRYDPSKAYLYNLNSRGQVFTKKYPTMLQERIEELSVPSAPFWTVSIIPADPSEPLPTMSKIKVDKDLDEGRAAQSSFWIPRHTLIQCMQGAVSEYNMYRTGDNGSIDIISGQECISVRPELTGDSSVMSVTLKDVRNGAEETREASLVVGADGMNSMVRNCLATDVSSSFSEWKNFSRKSFKLKKWTSPSSGLRMKCLQMSPKFQLKDSDGTLTESSSDITYIVRSIYKKPTTYISLSLLPMQDNNANRPSMFATRPNHEIWTMKDGESVRKWFQKAFPRLPFHKNGMISDVEWDRFAKAEGTRFPSCQFSPGMQASSNDDTCGVVLVGDSIHAFPPDIGQGINAGLADVVALDRSLRDSYETEAASLGSALKDYEKERRPETKALIRLSRFGAPYQYKQPHRIDTIRRLLWTANVIVRVTLNKLSFGLIPLASIMLSQNANLTFRQVMRRADSVTAGLVLSSSFVLYYLAKRLFTVFLRGSAVVK